MVWIKFLLCLIIILLAGTKLARYGDAIAEKTGLGRIWIGLVLLAVITSMPEMVTGISAAALLKLPDLAIGDFYGTKKWGDFLTQYSKSLTEMMPIIEEAMAAE